MTVGSFPAKRPGSCSYRECGRNFEPGDRIWFKTKERGWYCSARCLIEMFPDEKENCDKHAEKMKIYEKNKELADNLQSRSSTPLQVTTTARSDGMVTESDVARGHRENMESARQTRDMIALLVTTLNAIQKEMAVMVTVMRKFVPEEPVKEGKA